MIGCFSRETDGFEISFERPARRHLGHPVILKASARMSATRTLTPWSGHNSFWRKRPSSYGAARSW
jgi:hypothetical protein